MRPIHCVFLSSLTLHNFARGLALKSSRHRFALRNREKLIDGIATFFAENFVPLSEALCEQFFSCYLKQTVLSLLCSMLNSQQVPVRRSKATQKLRTHYVEHYYAFFPSLPIKNIWKKVRREIPLGNAALNGGIKAAEGRLWFFIILHLLFEVGTRDSRDSDGDVCDAALLNA